MRKILTKKQKGFAKDYIDSGNATLAVKQNYDVSTDNSAAVAGTRLLRNAKVIEYIEDKAEHAASIVYEIAQFGESDPVRLNASKDILDRAGYKPVERTQNLNVNIEIDVPPEIQELANELLNHQATD